MPDVQELLDLARDIHPGCPARLYLERLGIPAEVIEAHADQLRYVEADIPGRPRGEHALLALIRDASTGEVVAFQLSFCDPKGGKVARTRAHPRERRGTCAGTAPSTACS